jgi:superfamily II DNA/RNA helicase
MLAAAAAGVRSGQSGVQALVIVPRPEDVENVAARTSGAAVRVVQLGPAESARQEARAVSAGPAVVITTPERLIDHVRRENADVSAVRACVVQPPDDASLAQFTADLNFIYTKFNRPPATVLFGLNGLPEDSEFGELVRRPARIELRHSSPRATRPVEPKQERNSMAANKLPFDPESAAQQLRNIVRTIHEEEDPQELVAYKRFVKKHVSVFNRAYFTAYLFKQLVADDTGSQSRTSVFVSAGRNRRIHARDLVTLFTSANGVSRDDIGQIKVLDNYSFVEVESSKAKQAIDALNGTELRGRKLTVNYARRK